MEHDFTGSYQFYLDDIKDEFGFLSNIANWDNHRLMLLLSLELTQGTVIELGAGDGSTPYLRQYCQSKARGFNSYDSNQEWANKTGSVWVNDWDSANIWNSCSLLFVDHAPGEHRYIAIERMADNSDIIVIHDSEDAATGYMLSKIWHMFKYRLNYNRTAGGAGATAVSNKIDLNRFRGLSLGQYKFDND